MCTFFLFCLGLVLSSLGAFGCFWADGVVVMVVVMVVVVVAAVVLIMVVLMLMSTIGTIHETRLGGCCRTFKIMSIWLPMGFHSFPNL